MLKFMMPRILSRTVFLAHEIGTEHDGPLIFWLTPVVMLV